MFCHVPFLLNLRSPDHFFLQTVAVFWHLLISCVGTLNDSFGVVKREVTGLKRHQVKPKEQRSKYPEVKAEMAKNMIKKQTLDYIAWNQTWPMKIGHPKTFSGGKMLVYQSVACLREPFSCPMPSHCALNCCFSMSTVQLKNPKFCSMISHDW